MCEMDMICKNEKTEKDNMRTYEGRCHVRKLHGQ